MARTGRSRSSYAAARMSAAPAISAWSRSPNKKRLPRAGPGRALRSLADDLKRRIGSGVVAVVSRAEGKAAIVVGVTADLTARFDAVELVRAGAELLGGKGGGGRPDMAQAGGPDAEHAEAALAAVEQALKGRAGEAVAAES